VTETRFALNPGRLAAKPEAERALSLKSPQTVGQTLTEWHFGGGSPSMAEDQRLDDGGSLVFDTEPLAAPMELLGAPVVELSLACDRPQALVAARLSDVAPGGAATLVSYGLLNLSHRDSHEHAKPLVPGQRYTIRVKLNDCGRVFPAGHRVRIAISTAYWPIAWPSPEAVTLTLYAGTSWAILPVRKPHAGERPPPLPPIEMAPPLQTTVVRPVRYSETTSRDRASGVLTVTREDDRGTLRIDEIDLAFGWRKKEVFSIKPEDPLSARHEAHWTVEFARGPWQVRTESHTVMRSTKDQFLIEANIDAYEGSARVFCKSWQLAIPRDHV
jgi:hypothetical protein